MATTANSRTLVSTDMILFSKTTCFNPPLSWCGCMPFTFLMVQLFKHLNFLRQGDSLCLHG